MQETAKEKIIIDSLIISDIHLGEENVRAEALIGILREYEFNQLILNGDILNGLHFKRLNTNQWHILSAIRKLSKKCEVIWVHGNHDTQAHIISRLLGIRVVNKYIWQISGKKYLAIHGHQFDRFLNRNFILSQIVFAAYNFLKNIDQSGILPGLVRRHSSRWQRGVEEVKRGAARLGKTLGADCIFCGHTHKIEETDIDGIKYINTGAWNEKPSAFAVIAGEKAELIKIG